MTQLIRVTLSVLLKERPRRHLQKSWRDNEVQTSEPRAALLGEDQSRSRRNRAERFSTCSWRVGPPKPRPHLAAPRRFRFLIVFTLVVTKGADAEEEKMSHFSGLPRVPESTRLPLLRRLRLRVCKRSIYNL